MKRISVVIITKNEEQFIGRAILSCQAFADEIVVVDSHSTDKTAEIAATLGCCVHYNVWLGFAAQRNYAASVAQHDWIFQLDSDEVVSAELGTEMNTWKALDASYSAYTVYRRNCFMGRWLPDRERATRFYDRREHRYDSALVHEKVVARQENLGQMSGDIWHYGFRGLEDQLERFNRYTTLDAQNTYSQTKHFNPLRMFWRPPAKFVQKYVVHQFFKLGLTGFAISVFWAYYAFMKEVKILELHLTDKAK